MEGERRPKQGDFADPRARYSEKGNRYAQQQDSLAQRRHAACCNGANGRGYPLQGNTHRQQQPRDSSGMFPAEYAKLPQLGLYIITGTPDTTHQLHCCLSYHTMANTQPSCSREGESYRVPNTFKEVMGVHQAVRWKTVSGKEIASLEKHGVFNLLPITAVPVREKVIGTRWLFKIKADSTYNCRLVVPGFSQIPGVDCGGTFTPIYRLLSIRMMLAITLKLDYEVHMLDVQMAFLNADVDDDVFVQKVLSP